MRYQSTDWRSNRKLRCQFILDCGIISKTEEQFLGDLVIKRKFIFRNYVIKPEWLGYHYLRTRESTLRHLCKNFQRLTNQSWSILTDRETYSLLLKDRFCLKLCYQFSVSKAGGILVRNSYWLSYQCILTVISILSNWDISPQSIWYSSSVNTICSVKYRFS